MYNLNLKGILPPVPTPFDERGDLNLQGLSANISRYNETGLAGYVALGSNGEAVHLSRRERAQVIETIRRAAAPGLTVVAGVNEFTPQAAIEAARQAADLGADAALVITPYFYKSRMTQEALAQFFLQVADSSLLPVLVYNVPQNTGVIIEPATIASLSEHERIVGVKDSAGNMAAISETVRRVPENFPVLVGNGGIFYPALAMGAAGAVLAVGCVAPRQCVELYNAASTGDQVKSRELQNRIGRLSQVVTAEFGVAGLKFAMETAGFVGGLARPPLLPLNEREKSRVKEVMSQTGLFSEID